MSTRPAARAAAVLPRDLAANPRLSTWVRVEGERVRVRVGKVELGQGILTALARIAAEELQVRPDRIVMEPADTAASPDEGITAGSMSVTESGAALRYACAELRALLLAAAARACGVRPGELSVLDGVVHDAAGRPLAGYAELAASVPPDAEATGAAPPRFGPAATEGGGPARLDLPDKVYGRPRFIHDLVLPGMAHGRVVRPARRAAALAALDGDPCARLPGILAVVRDGTFLGVVAEREDVAERAAAALAAAATWTGGTPLPDEDDLAGHLLSGPVETTVLAGPAAPDGTGGTGRLAATYTRPFLAHASIAPSCAIATWTGEGVDVHTHSQGVFALRRAVAAALALDEAAVRVRHVEGAGCYGHNPADDVAFDAVLLARAVPGRPVRVQWSRRDELSRGPFGSAMLARVSATLGGDGQVERWEYDVYSHGHVSRPGYAGGPGLLAAGELAGAAPLPAATDPPPERGGGTSRNALPAYRFPAQRVAVHRLTAMPLRTSALRSLGAHLNVFAIESFMDELAAAAGRDPLEFRLAHLDDERARAVLSRAAGAAGWGGPPDGDSTGRGIGFARYKNRGAWCAAVAEVTAVDRVRVRRLVLAVDVGRVVDLDGVRNQIEGGAVQSTSWTVTERVRFDRSEVTSVDWETYPILRFSEVPRVEVHVLDRPDQPSLGAGEAAQGPVAAAIANAVHDAIGVRVRDLPLTPERVIAAMGPGG